MKVKIEKEEIWHVYNVYKFSDSLSSGLLVEISEELCKRYIKASTEFFAVQELLEKAYDES